MFHLFCLLVSTILIYFAEVSNYWLSVLFHISLWGCNEDITSTRKCVTQLTNMRVAWNHFPVGMRNLGSLAGITSSL